MPEETTTALHSDHNDVDSGQPTQLQESPVGTFRDAEREAWNQIVSAVRRLPEEAQSRVLDSALTFLGFAGYGGAPPRGAKTGAGIPPSASQGSFSEDRTPSPKEFIVEKKPATDIERITCLAYYLTHYRGKPMFNTLDLSKLNTEAAQIKFSNPTVAVNNATAAGFLVPAGKGEKQISSNGELYVQALPDRDAAKAAIAHARPRRKLRREAVAREAEDDPTT